LTTKRLTAAAALALLASTAAHGASLGNIGHNFGGLFDRVLGSGEVGSGPYAYHPYDGDDDDDAI
jgi:hypothetical protein